MGHTVLRAGCAGVWTVAPSSNYSGLQVYDMPSLQKLHEHEYFLSGRYEESTMNSEKL
jgi:hypothetical protein